MEVELLHANPEYAYIRKSDCKEDTVSLRDLAPLLEFIKGNLQVESITGSEPGPHSDTGSNEENQITENSEMLDWDTTDPDIIVVR